MTVAQIEQKLEHHKTVLSESEAKLDELRRQRAKLALADSTKNKTEIAKLDKEIGQHIFDCNNLPSEIEVLESDLAAARKKVEERERSKLITNQKKSAEQVEILSKQFVEILEQAVAANSKLDLAYRNYCTLRTATKEDCMGKSICRGSAGSLKYLFEICKKEMQGELVIRQPMIAVPI